MDDEAASKHINDIKDWLVNTGYPLEMRVAKYLLDVGAKVIQGKEYKDSTTGKMRETDVFATFAHYKEKVYHKTNLVIECKSSLAPWISFKGPPSDNGSAHPYTSWDENCEICTAIQQAESESFPEGADSYSVVEKRTKGEHKPDMAYSGVQAITDAVTALFPGYDPERRDHSTEKKWLYCSIFLPIVVTTSRLYSCLLDEAGELVVETADHCTLNFAQADRTREDIPVHVFTEAAFQATVATFAATLPRSSRRGTPVKESTAELPEARS